MLHDYDKLEINVAHYFEISFRCVTDKANIEILVNLTASIQICTMILPNTFSCSNKLPWMAVVFWSNAYGLRMDADMIVSNKRLPFLNNAELYTRRFRGIQEQEAQEENHRKCCCTYGKGICFCYNRSRIFIYM